VVQEPRFQYIYKWLTLNQTLLIQTLHVQKWIPLNSFLREALKQPVADMKTRTQCPSSANQHNYGSTSLTFDPSS
jgi:hypothetical protein